MWRNPKYFPPEKEPAAPVPTGRELAILPRPKREGPDDALRVALDTYEGHLYVSIRVFSRDHAGQLWPVKGRGVSVRVGELADVAEALKTAERLVAAERGEPARTAVARSRGRRPAEGQGMLPAEGGGEAFSEFD